MSRWWFSAFALLGALGTPVGARAQADSALEAPLPIAAPSIPAPSGPAPSWTPASRLSLLADVRGELGPGRVAGIDLGLVGVGLEWRATATLRLQASALLLGAAGMAPDGTTAHGGAGGELAARLVPFPEGPLRPYLRASGGLLLFLRGPFLPGGDSYDFVLQLGAGLEVPIGDRLSLFGELHLVHLSNGQGLGPFNPAFTGAGGLVGAACALAPPGPPTPPESIPPVDEARPNWHPGATFDAGAGHAPAGLALAVRDRVAERLSRHTLALMDIESGTIHSAHFVEAGLDLAGHWTLLSAGVHGGYRQGGGGAGTFVTSGQVEAVVTSEASLVLMGEADLPRATSTRMYRGALVVRLLPIDTLLIELGGGAEDAGGGAGGLGFNPTFAVDWQLPFGVRTWQVSLFVERQLDGLGMAGVRISWDMGSTLRDLVRRTGWRRVR
ncbi:MAG TPA: hypothetical protein VKZ18_04425 [Polyangia bacterium]|nr:hypothetical protein [Polyangia bacterium]